MSKHDKDYDTSMLRFCGNLIASRDWTTYTSDQITKFLVPQAIAIATAVRAELRKEQKDV